MYVHLDYLERVYKLGILPIRKVKPPENPQISKQ